MLVLGAGGGVGSTAVLVAKAMGARVTAVTSARNADVARAVSADEVVDRDAEDATRHAGAYDVVFDVSGTLPLRRCRRAVAPQGTLLVVGAPSGAWLGPLKRFLRAAALARLPGPRVAPYVAKQTPDDLLALKAMAEADNLTPFVEKVVPLAEAPDALRRLGEGHARGKVVIRVTASGARA